MPDYNKNVKRAFNPYPWNLQVNIIMGLRPVQMGLVMQKIELLE